MNGSHDDIAHSRATRVESQTVEIPVSPYRHLTPIGRILPNGRTDYGSNSRTGTVTFTGGKHQSTIVVENYNIKRQY